MTNRAADSKPPTMLPRTGVLLFAAASLLACSSKPAADQASSVTSSGSGGSVPMPVSKTKIASASVGEVLEVTARGSAVGDSEGKSGAAETKREPPYGWSLGVLSALDLHTLHVLALDRRGQRV